MIIDDLKNIFRKGVTNFQRFSVKYIISILLCLKCFSINIEKYLPTFILASQQKGAGLNNIIFLFLFFLLYILFSLLISS